MGEPEASICCVIQGEAQLTIASPLNALHMKASGSCKTPKKVCMKMYINFHAKLVVFYDFLIGRKCQEAAGDAAAGLNEIGNNF